MPKTSVDISLWTGSHVLVLGRPNGDEQTTFKGGLFNPSNKKWTAIPDSGAPHVNPTDIRKYVWNGSRLYTWGGHSFLPNRSNETVTFRSIFDPVLNQWLPMSSSGEPRGRQSHTISRIGDTIIIWGGWGNGTGGGVFADGGRYLISQDRWGSMSTVNAPSARFAQESVVVGEKLVIWGGFSSFNDEKCPHSQTNGGIYDPANDIWTRIPTAGGPTQRCSTSAVVSDGTKRILVWGGSDTFWQGFKNDGFIYDLEQGLWTSVDSTNAPSPRRTAVNSIYQWNKRGFVIFGGLSTTFVPDGGIYDPVSRKWTRISQPPFRIDEFTQMFLRDDELIVWGNLKSEQTREWFISEGGVYDFDKKEWRSLPKPSQFGHRHLMTNAFVLTPKGILNWGGFYRDPSQEGLRNDGWFLPLNK